MAYVETSPLTGIIAEETVFIDFGEHEGKSILEVSDTHPNYYDFLVTQREKGNFAIKRNKNKMFTLHCNESQLLN